MITLHRSGRSRSSDSNNSDTSNKKIVTAGSNYVTKRNGKLYLNRPKQPKHSNIAVGLISQTLGRKLKLARRCSVSSEAESAKPPLMVGGVPFVPQLQHHHSAPLPQQPFQPILPIMPQESMFTQYYPYVQPLQPFIPAAQHFIPSFQVYNPGQPIRPRSEGEEQQPNQEDLEKLKDFEAHYRNIIDSNDIPSKQAARKTKQQGTSTVQFNLHVCARCGEFRSKKYHKGHPLKENETPERSYCKKCQNDDSSKSEPGSEKEKRRPREQKHRNSDKDYIIVEEKVPRQTDRRRRPRSTSRNHGNLGVYRKSTSSTYLPLRSATTGSNSRSGSTLDIIQEGSEKLTQPQRCDHRRPNTHSAQQSTTFRYIDPSTVGRDLERSKGKHSKKNFTHMLGEEMEMPSPSMSSVTSLDQDSNSSGEVLSDEQSEIHHSSVPFEAFEEELYDSAPRWGDNFKGPTEFFTESRSSGNGNWESKDASSCQSRSFNPKRRDRGFSSTTDDYWAHPCVTQAQRDYGVTTECAIRQDVSNYTEDDEEAERRLQERVDRYMKEFGLRSADRFHGKYEKRNYCTEDWSHNRYPDAKSHDDSEDVWSSLFLQEETYMPRQHPGGKSYRRNLYRDSELGESETAYRSTTNGTPRRLDFVFCTSCEGNADSKAASRTTSRPATFSNHHHKSRPGHPNDPFADDDVQNHEAERQRASYKYPPQVTSHEESQHYDTYARAASSEEHSFIYSSQSSSNSSFVRSPHVRFDSRVSHDYPDKRHRLSSAAPEYEVEEVISVFGSAKSASSENSSASSTDELLRDAMALIKRVVIDDGDETKRSRGRRDGRRLASHKERSTRHSSRQSIDRHGVGDRGWSEWERRNGHAPRGGAR